MYRTDKFKVGDRVTWSDPHYATITQGWVKYGEGPFKIIAVRDVPKEYDRYDDTTNWDSMTHTQMVTIDIPYQQYDLTADYSGAFFRVVLFN
jgi:hypothetical protein